MKYVHPQCEFDSGLAWPSKLQKVNKQANKVQVVRKIGTSGWVIYTYVYSCGIYDEGKLWVTVFLNIFCTCVLASLMKC